MMPPKHIYTRQIAIVEELGFDSSKVVADSFDEKGFRLHGIYPEAGIVYGESQMPLYTQYMWTDEKWRDRGLKARLDDFNETFGATDTP